MKRLRIVAFLLSGIFGCSNASAQNDTTYYVSYTHLITGRIFLSQKYTELTLRNKSGPYTLNYVPNAKFNAGFGASYKWATLNFAAGVGYLNPDDGKGKTSYIDLQFHKYTQKFTFDLVGQSYTGFYLFPKGTASADDRYYTRPDLKVTMFGGTAQYVVNNRRFSVQATYLQNEWQKKSAGSILVGIETYAGRIRGDSTIIPSGVDTSLTESNIDFFEAGINAGYAYTFVIRKHFFVTGSASASLDFSSTTMRNADGSHVRSGVSPNTFFRLVTGYNSRTWALQIIYLNNGVRLGDDVRTVALNTGNLRLSYVHRFSLGSKEKKVLKIIK